MATYQITINEKAKLGRSLMTVLQSIPHVVTFEKSGKKEAKNSWLYGELEEALKDVRLMREGKKKEKTLDELITELRKERENELQDSAN